MSWLAPTWFVLFVVIVTGYAILDGFDLGVGILSPFVARNDHDRRVLLNSIGPVWDGNEVWLVLAGGALFAAFPLVYASLFSGFYMAMMLVLLVLILRTVAIEFRSKRPGSTWRSTWDWFFFASSLGITLLLGVALGNVVRGVAIDAAGNMTVDLVELLNPYSLLIGVTAVAMLSLHGAIFLTQKVTDELLVTVKRFIPRLGVAFFVLATASVIATLQIDSEMVENFGNRPWTVLFPVVALLATVTAWRLVENHWYLAGFLASATTIAMLMASIAAGLYPVMLPSSVDATYDLTVHNAAAAENSLQVMFVIALIGMPFVILYTAGIYFFFRGKVEIDDASY